MNLLPMKQADAEVFATRALGWIAGEPDCMAGFLGMTGAEIGDLRARAADPEFLGFVVDYLLGNEEMLLACAEALGAAPEMFQRARAGLPGGDLPHWT